MANDVRKPPVREIYALHLPREKGKCGWCGLSCDERTPVRKQLRQTHYACSAEVQLIQSPEVARRHVFDRDHGICADCGENWSERYRFQKGVECTIHSYWDSDERADYDAGLYRYTEVIWVSLWHVDHHVPLWKAQHMPAVQRIEYFKLANLVTRCDPCHKIKTRKEAGARKKYNAHGPDEPPEKPKFKRTWPKRKLKSRSSFR